MEATGEQEGGNSEDLTGKKRPKLQMLKSRLFGKMKRKENEGVMKQSQSASDIMQGIQDLEDDFQCSQSRLASRSLSHDSIFLAEQCQSEPEPPRVLSQENIHGKIRALQLKLQQQNMHLGPPPLVLSIKCSEDAGGSSEDDGLPHSPPEILGLSKSVPHKFPIPDRNHSSLSLGGTGSEEEEQSSLQQSSQPVSPKPIIPMPVPLSPSAPGPGIDFSTPPQFIPCLDNSAARHRMSIKPRNQRASTKSRRLPASDECRPRSESMNNLERSLTESEEEEGAAVTKEMTRVRSYSSQIIRPGEVLSTPPTKIPLSASPLKSLAGAADGCVTSAKSPPGESILTTTTTLNQAALTKGSSLKSEGVTAMGSKQAPSSTMPTSKKESGGIQHSSRLISNITATPDKRDEIKDTVECQPQASAAGVVLRPPSLRRNTSPLDDKVVSRTLQQISTAPLSGQEKKSAEPQRPMSGSFRFSVSAKSHERQRAGSFTGVVDQKREPVSPHKAQDQLRCAQVRTMENVSSSLAAPTKPKDLTPTPSAGRDRADSRSGETQETGVEATEEDVQEGVEEADEASEDLKGNEVEEDRNAFGVKLRTTSLSLKFRADNTHSELGVKQHHSEVNFLTQPAPEGQKDTSTGPVRGNTATTVFKKPPTHNESIGQAASVLLQSVSRDQEKNIPNKLEDMGSPAQPSALLIKGTKGTVPHKESPPVQLTIKESQPVSLALKEAMENIPSPSAAREPQEASFELSWMSMAREKTRSLQQMFTSRLPDFSSLQTTTRSPNTTSSPPQSQTSTLHPSAGASKPVHQSLSTQSSVRPPQAIPASVKATQPITAQPPTMQPSATSQAQTTQLSARPGEPLTSSSSPTKPAEPTASFTSTTQSNTQSVHPAKQQLCQPSIHKATRIHQSLPQSLAQSQASHTAMPSTQPSSLHLLTSPKLTPQQPVCLLSEPRSQTSCDVPSTPLKTNWVSAPHVKSPAESRTQWGGGRRDQQTPDASKGDNQTSTPESRTPPQPLAAFRAMSSPSKFTESAASSGSMRQDRDDKWQKKTVPPSSSPSSSSSSPPLQSVSDSGQPSWMELAKRKSLAWSDKSMD